MFAPNSSPSSVVLVSPRMIAPACSSSLTSFASPLGKSFSSAIEPALVGSPATSMESSTSTGMPSSGSMGGAVGACLVARLGFLEHIRVDVPDRLDAGPVGVGQRDPVELGLDQLFRAQRPAFHHRLEALGARTFQRERQQRGLAAEHLHDRLVVGVAVTAAGEGRRGHGVRAAIHRRVDLARAACAAPCLVRGRSRPRAGSDRRRGRR